MSLLNRMGITSANEASIVSADQLQAWQHLRDDGALTLRLYLNIYPVYGDDWDRDTAAYSVFNSGLRTGFGDDWLRLGPAVIGVDGGVQGETAALFQPYANSADPTYRGKFRVSEELLRDFCMEAQQRGFQIGAVAHGDWAISVTMDAIEAAAKAFPRGDTRHRLEHAYLWTPELLTRARTLGLVVSSQPPILEALGEACTVTPWGEERAAYAFPYRTMLTLGLVASGGSDMPVANANPWEGVRALVVREIEGLVGKRIIGS